MLYQRIINENIFLEGNESLGSESCTLRTRFLLNEIPGTPWLLLMRCRCLSLPLHSILLLANATLISVDIDSHLPLIHLFDETYFADPHLCGGCRESMIFVLEYCPSMISCCFFFILIVTNVPGLSLDHDLRHPFVHCFMKRDTSVP